MPAAGENGEPLTLLDLFRQGVYEGGEEEAIEAYEEAMEAIFGMHVASHRHTQCTYSKKRPGQKRFVMFEMWPLAVRCLPLMMWHAGAAFGGAVACGPVVRSVVLHASSEA